jgi:hypothetical protein
VTDCYAVKFLLLYNGTNQAILRLQMRLMGWDVDIVHRTNDHLVDANYWSRLNADICYDPSFRKYLHIVNDLCKAHPPPTSLPMRDENMPYYCSPRIPVEHCPSGTSTDDPDGPAVDTVATALATSIVTADGLGSTSLCIRPVRFGKFSMAESPPPIRELYNNKFLALVYQAMNFLWAVYGFNSGHLFSTIAKRNLPFHVVLACDPFEYGQALFHKFSKCPTVLPSAGALLDHIPLLGKQAPLDGYLIHSHRYQMNEPATTFWNIQAAIVTQLRLIRQLNLFVAFVHPDHNGRSVSKFVNQLPSSGWVLSRTTCLFPNFGDSVIGGANLVVGVHDSTQSRTEPISFRIPLSPTPLPLVAYI